jgi:hypothetical protein
MEENKLLVGWEILQELVYGALVSHGML